MKQLFNITKKYENKSFKNTNEEENITWDEAVSELSRLASSWRRNGGVVIDHQNNFLIVEEADGSETITFEIDEN